MSDSSEKIEDKQKTIRKIIHVDMDAFYASVEQSSFGLDGDQPSSGPAQAG